MKYTLSFFILLLWAGLSAQEADLPPIYEANATEPDGWYKVHATFDTHTDTASFKVYVRNDFEVFQFTDETGKQRIRVINRNPYTYSMPGTDVFDLPAPERKRRFLGIFKRRK